jgi:hypothetical protein
MNVKKTNTDPFRNTTATNAEKLQKSPEIPTSQDKERLKEPFSQAPSITETARAQAKTIAGLIQSLQAQDLSQNPHRSLSEVLSLGFNKSLLKETSCQKAIEVYMQALVSILDPVKKDSESSLQAPEPLATLSLLEDIERQAPLLESLTAIKPLYKRIYQYYSNAYFNHKQDGNLPFLSGTDADSTRLQAVFKEQFKAFILNVYHPKHITTDIPFYRADFNLVAPPTPQNITCIHNTEGYFNITDEAFSEYLSSETILGKALSLQGPNSASPIGYNIYLPENPKALLVRVYGGYGTHDICKAAAYEFNFIKNFEKVLLHQGIAVANLSLPDLLELNEHQSVMRKDLYLKIQSCIHTFYSTLHESPEKLDTKLLALKNLPIFLGGNSFGAGLSLNHSKLYPNTFTGYISSCGVLDPASHRGALDPSQIDYHFPTLETASTVQEPVLVFQNFNDRNVRAQNGLKWANEAYKHNTAFQLCILHNGATAGPPTHQASIYSGHATPTTESSFQTYTQHLAAFLLDHKKQSSGITEDINRWRSHEYGSYFQKYNNYKDPETQEWKGKLDKQFLSEAYRIYKNSRPALNLDGHPAPEKNLASLITDPKYQKASWSECYFPLYKASYLADQFNFSMLSDLQMCDNIDTKINTISESLFHTLLPAMSQYYTANISLSEEDKKACLGYLKKTLMHCISSPMHINYQLTPLVHSFLKAFFHLYPEAAEEVVAPSKIREADAQSEPLKKKFLKQIHKSRSLGAKVIAKTVSHLHTNKRLEKLVKDYRSSPKSF